MKFTAFVITKKKILTIFAAAALTAAVSASCVLMINGILRGEKTEEAFSAAPSYEEILAEGVSGADTTHGSLKSILSRIVGFDADDPRSVIGEYSAALGGSDTDISYAPENGYGGGQSNTESDTSPAPSELPSHEMICASKGLKMNNATSYKINLDELCAAPAAVKADISGDAQVLIVHTHTTECYLGDEMSGETERTTDETKNVISIGNEICSVLESFGIKTMHDTTYHDYPSYQGSYTRALSTIDRILKQNPSIKAVLDIHRDAFIYSDGSRLRVACSQNGVETSQVMLVVGTNSMGLWHENWRDNLTFAAKIQNAAEIMYPGLMRPVNVRTERFNQHMTRGSLIIEVGSNGNTLDEAKNGGRDVAYAIAAALLNG